MADAEPPAWVVEARRILNPVVSGIRRELYRRYPSLPVQEIREIVDAELSVSIYEMLSDRSQLNVQTAHEVLLRIERLCGTRCAERSGRSPP